MRDMFSPGDAAFQSGHDENFDLLKSWAAVSLAFAIFIAGGQVFNIGFLISLLIASITCGIGFVLHELAHRVVARNYGAEAHFAASPDGMLLLPILVAFLGLFLAAPGAVWHRGYLTQQQLGLVAIAGPITNLVLAFVFFGLLLVLAPSLSIASAMDQFWLNMLWIGFNINAWLGLFNMIPADPFDGGKVWRWNKVVYGVTAAVALLTVFGLPMLFG
jgi:Zn-dependent protease